MMNLTTGMRIKIQRLKQSKMQGDIAVLGISVAGYCRIEKGDVDINVSRLCKIAATLGVTPQSLIGDDSLQQALILENQALQKNLAESRQYTAQLQGKLIAAYEMLGRLKQQYTDHGVLDLTGS
jgi:transcriptional regulator with XRE-family HTH domain